MIQAKEQLGLTQARFLGSLGHSDLEFVSDFDIRISNLWWVIIVKMIS